MSAVMTKIPDPAEQPLMTAEQARLVYGVGRELWYRMLREGQVPGAFRLGPDDGHGLWRVRTAELHRALLGEGVPPAA